MLAAFVAERPRFTAYDELKQQCCQNKLANMLSSNLAGHRFILHLTEAVLDIPIGLYLAILKEIRVSTLNPSRRLVPGLTLFTKNRMPAAMQPLDDRNLVFNFLYKCLAVLCLTTVKAIDSRLSL